MRTDYQHWKTRGELPITNPKMDMRKPISTIYLSCKGSKHRQTLRLCGRTIIQSIGIIQISFFQQLKRAGTAKTNCKENAADFQQPCVCAIGHRNTGWPLFWLLTTRAVSLNSTSRQSHPTSPLTSRRSESVAV